MIRRCLFYAIALLFIFQSRTIYSFSFPDVFFFSFSPGYTFSLVSESGNKIDVETKIELTDDFKESGVFFVRWNLLWRIDELDVFYSIRFMALSDGNVYLDGINDKVYYRTFFEDILIFPKEIEFNKSILINDNIIITYIEQLSVYKVNNKNFYDVIKAKLTLDNKEVTVYFARRKGIIEIITRNETYRYPG